jgi:hypothetical protein
MAPRNVTSSRKPATYFPRTRAAGAALSRYFGRRKPAAPATSTRGPTTTVNADDVASAAIPADEYDSPEGRQPHAMMKSEPLPPLESLRVLFDFSEEQQLRAESLAVDELTPSLIRMCAFEQLSLVYINTPGRDEMLEAFRTSGP